MKYHLIGIGGSSMSGLAEILVGLGHKVTGCDIKELKVKNSKFKTYFGHSEKHISKDLDGVIVSAAITEKSAGFKEVQAAKKLGIPVISRAKMIGQIMSKPEIIGIGVAGTHGKTTVAAMIFSILEKAGQNPSFSIGGEIKGIGNGKWGKGKYFVVEACEYDRQFLDLRPKIAIITNIEEEHLDTYPRGFVEIKKAFKKFVKLLPKYGLLVLFEEDKTTPWLSKSAICKVKTYSEKNPWPGLKLKIPGKYNILNATAAARVCHELGISHSIIKKALNEYEGVKRRIEKKGIKNGILVFDDYAHHPTEIRATLVAIKEAHPKKRIVCVFQAHQYFRTETLLPQFARAFKDADQVIIAEIFAVAGRDEKRKIKTEDLVKAIKKHQKEVLYIKDYSKIADYLAKNIQKDNILITMGATDIYKVGESFLGGR